MYSAYVTHVQSMAVEVFTAFTPIIPANVLTDNTGVTLTSEDFLLDDSADFSVTDFLPGDFGETADYALDDGFGSYLVTGIVEDLLASGTASSTVGGTRDFSPTDFSPTDFA